MALSVGEVEATLRLKDELTAQMSTAISALDDFASAAMRAGLVLTASLTAPIVGLGTAALQASLQFESSMTKVETLSAVAGEAVAHMRDEVLALAPATGIGPDELAKGLLVVTSTGLRGAEAMEILSASAKASAVGLGEVNDIARAVTAAIVAYGKENLSAAEAADKLFVGVVEGGAEAEEFAQSLGRVLGVAAKMGVSFDEVVASVATFTRLGVDADEAITALRGTLMTFLHPTEQARDVLKGLGLSVQDVRDSIRENGLQKTLTDLVTALGNNEQAIGTLIPNVRALAGVLGNTGSQAEQYAEILGRVQTASGQLNDAFDRTSQTGMFKWNQFIAEGKVLLIEFGDAIAPMARDIIDLGVMILENFIKPLVDGFNHLPGPLKEIAIGIAGVGAVIGPLLGSIGFLATGLSSIITLMGTLQVAMGLEAGLAGTIALLSGPVGWGALAVAMAAIAIPTAITALPKALKDVQDELEPTNRKILENSEAYKLAAKYATEYKKATGGKVDTSPDGSTPAPEGATDSSLGSKDLAATNLALANMFDTIQAGGEAMDKSVIHAKTYTEQLAILKQKVDELTPAQEAEIDAGKRLGASDQEVADGMKVSVEVIKGYISLHKDATKEVNAHQNEVKQLADKWGTAIEKAHEWDEALQLMASRGESLSNAGWKEYTEAIDKGVDAMKRAGQEIPSAWQTISNTVKTDDSLQKMRDSIGQTTVVVKMIGDIVPDVGRMIDEFGHTLARFPTSEEMGIAGIKSDIMEVDRAIDEIDAKVSKADFSAGIRADIDSVAERVSHFGDIAEEREKTFKALGQSFTDLGQTVGGGAGVVINAVGKLMENLEQFKGISEPVAKGAAAIAEGVAMVWESTNQASVGANMMSGALAGLSAGLNPELMAATAGWSAGIGAAAGAMVGLVRATDKANEEQKKALEESANMAQEWKAKVVEAFDETATGMMRLQAGGETVQKVALMISTTYGDLGHSTEEITDVMKRLFDAERQGPEELQKVLDEVTDEFERHDEVVKQWASGINNEVEGFGKRVEGFVQGLSYVSQAQTDANKAAEVASQRYQEAADALDKLKASGVATQDEIAAATQRADQLLVASEKAKLEAMSATGIELGHLKELQEQANKAVEDSKASYEAASVAIKQMKTDGVSTQEDIIAATEHAKVLFEAYEQAKQAAAGLTAESLKALREAQEQVNASIEAARLRYEEASQAADKMKTDGVSTAEEIAAAEAHAHDLFVAYEAEKQQSLGATAESLVKVQEQFDILEQYALTAFNTVFTQSGSAVQAISAIHEPLLQLQQAEEDFGLKGSAAFDKLSDIDRVISANKDIFTSIDGLNQMMLGLRDSTMLTKEDMVLFGRDATQLFDELVSRMVDQGTPAAEAMNLAMLLMQPTLQTLWEGQKEFGVQIDGATQKLIDQAVEAGYVGEAHRDIQKRILEAIQGVEQAILRLPEAFAHANESAGNLLATMRTIGTEAGQMQIGVGAYAGSGGITVATSVTDVQNDLMERWFQMYGTRDIPAEQKHIQNQAMIAQGLEPIWPGFKQGGMIGPYGQGYAFGGTLESIYGTGAVQIVAHVGESILNARATAALGKEAIDALNRDPLAVIDRIVNAVISGASESTQATFADVQQMVAEQAHQIAYLQNQMQDAMQTTQMAVAKTQDQVQELMQMTTASVTKAFAVMQESNDSMTMFVAKMQDVLQNRIGSMVESQAASMNKLATTITYLQDRVGSLTTTHTDFPMSLPQLQADGSYGTPLPIGIGQLDLTPLPQTSQGGDVNVSLSVGGNVFGLGRDFQTAVTTAVLKGLQQDGEAWGTAETIVQQMASSR